MKTYFRLLPAFSLSLIASLQWGCTTSSDVASGRVGRPTDSAPTWNGSSAPTGARVPVREVPKTPAVLAERKSAAPVTDTNPNANAAYRQVHDTPDGSALYMQARQKLLAKQSAEAIPLLETYLKQQPTGQFVDETAFFLGRDALNRSDDDAAVRYFDKVTALQPPSKLRGQAYYLSAVAHSQANRRREALSALSHVDLQEIPFDQRYALFSFWGDVAAQEGHALEATLANVKAWHETTDPAKRKKIEDAVTEVINSRLTEPELQFVLKQYPADFLSNELQMRLVAVKIASGQRAEAKQLLERIAATTLPESALHKRAVEMLARVDSLQVSNSEKIGALLPLSGDQESLGRSVADGLRQALEKAGHHNFELVLADSGSTVESAKSSFERLVFEDKVMAVVGPLSGSQAEMVAAKAVEYGVPNITMAVRSGLIEQGPYVFRVALTPQKQVQAIVGYSHEKLNAHNFAILFPRDNFGREFAAEYFKAVKDWGGEVTAAETFDPEQSDFRVQIDNMVGMSFPQFRRTELDERLKLQEEKLGRKLTHKETESYGLQPIVDFDVLFIPDTFRAVGQIVPALLYANVTTPKLVGPSTWNNMRLLQRAGQYLDGGLFVDIFSTERQNSATKNFVEKFQVDKGGMPSPLAAVGYDIGMALRLAYGTDSGPSSRDELRSKLEVLGSVEGVCGLYNWDARRDPLMEVQLFAIRHGAFLHQGGVVVRPSRD